MTIRKRWLESEEMYLKENYPLNGTAFCAHALDRSNRQIMDKVRKLGLKRKQTDQQRCSHCKQLKTLDAFFIDKRGRNGRHAMCKECTALRLKHRYTHNSDYRLKRLLRRKYRILFDKSHSIPMIFGCTLNDMHTHIEKQFTGDMSWSTRDWQIDHIIPLDVLKNRYDKIHLVFNYRNHQPLSPQDNILKSNDLQKAKEHLLRKMEMFGEDDFYWEMLDFLNECLLE